MMNEDEKADDGKQSKRDRFKGALARTKSKFKKDSDKSKNTQLPDEVDDFLAAGRTSTSSRTTATDVPPHPPTNPFLDGKSTSPASTRPSTADSNTHSFVAPRQSPRKIVVPKIDVSDAQRWPQAKSVNPKEQEINDFLRPEYQGRSQSATSLIHRPGKKRRGRELSVSFIDAPPIIIGEGGDNAPTPPVEIGRARERARSASPMPRRNHGGRMAPIDGTYGNGPASALPSRRQVHALPDVLRPKMVQRVQTGLDVQPTSIASLDQEFEMTLGLGSNGTSPVSTIGSTPNTPDFIAPRPIRVVQPPPAVFGEPAEHQNLKKQESTTGPKQASREGDTLRMHLDDEPMDGVNDLPGWRSHQKQEQTH